MTSGPKIDSAKGEGVLPSLERLGGSGLEIWAYKVPEVAKGDRESSPKS